MKENFLKSWRGSTAFGYQNQWAKAQGSSLKDGEKKVLKDGGIVKHPKGKSLTKVFACDEKGNLWSVIVHNLHLTSLENSLKEVGYLLPAA